ncbi:MAG TPA: acyltransferase family protein, partial [Devosia sp.]|nr:acyltransferase family protein [Devosia sp.]
VTGLQFVALHRLGYTPIYGKFDWQHFGAQLFMASDWIRTGLSFNGPVWSVSVEIAIYAVFWITRGFARRFGAFFTIVMALAFVYADHEWGAKSGVLSCGSYFFAGCTLSILREGRFGKGWLLGALVALLAVAGLGVTLYWGEWGWRIFGITGMFGALFLMLAKWQDRAPAWLDRSCEWLGENTYGVYLWHFPIQLTLMVLLMPAIKTQNIAQNGWFLALFFVLTVTVARVSYVYFERPMRDFLRERLGGSRHAVKDAAKGG